MPQYHSPRFPLGKEGGFSQRNHRVAACKPFRSGILLAVLCWLAFCAGTVSLWADTCSYTYSCSGPQCGMTMGGMSGTRSQSGVTFAQCEAARQMAPHSTTCVCTSDGAGASGTAIPVATGNLTQDLVSAGANAMIMNIKNPYVSVFMQHATNSFLVSLFSNSQGNADQQRQMMEQRQIMEQQLLEHQRELERQRRIAEQQRLDAMFARLNRKLKLEGMPFNLTLKAMNTETDLELKSMNSGGPDGLKLKISNANPTSYGLKGLPEFMWAGLRGLQRGIQRQRHRRTQTWSLVQVQAQLARESPACPVFIWMEFNRVRRRNWLRPPRRCLDLSVKSRRTRPCKPHKRILLR